LAAVTPRGTYSRFKRSSTVSIGSRPTCARSAAANRKECLEVFIIGVEHAVIGSPNVEGNGAAEQLHQGLIMAWSAAHHNRAGPHVIY